MEMAEDSMPEALKAVYHEFAEGDVGRQPGTMEQLTCKPWRHYLRGWLTAAAVLVLLLAGEGIAVYAIAASMLPLLLVSLVCVVLAIDAVVATKLHYERVHFEDDVEYEGVRDSDKLASCLGLTSLPVIDAYIGWTKGLLGARYAQTARPVPIASLL